MALRRAAAVVAASAWAALAAAPAGADVKLSTDPGLRPHFQRSVTDYVSTCVPGRPLVLFVSASGGDKVAVGRHPARGGEFVQSVRRQPGGGVAVHVRSSTRSASYHIRCLPSDFPKWTASRDGKPQAQWYVITPNGNLRHGYLAIFDSNGIPVWWRHASSYGPWDAKLMPGGDIAWTHYKGGPFGQDRAYGYEEHRLDGRNVRIVRAVGHPTDTHDMQRMPNGHYLVIAYLARHGVDLRAFHGPANATVYDGEIQELTPSGRLVWSWNSHDHIPLSETGRWWTTLVAAQKHKPPDKRFYDLVHLNTVEPDGRGLIVSARHLDAVFRIDRRSGAIRWKLGGTHRPESLAVHADPLADMPFGGQHDARLYRDGTLTVFDNGTNLVRPPRSVRYRIDTKARTATLLEQVADADVTRSGFGGSARKLRGGDWVTCWGGSTVVTEQRPSGKHVFGIFFRNSRYSYRAVPIPPGRISARVMRRAMDRMSRVRRSALWR